MSVKTHGRGHKNDSLYEFSPDILRHRGIAPFKFGSRKAIAIFEWRHKCVAKQTRPRRRREHSHGQAISNHCKAIARAVEAVKEIAFKRTADLFFGLKNCIHPYCAFHKLQTIFTS
jgi:hypothetical protein